MKRSFKLRGAQSENYTNVRVSHQAPEYTSFRSLAKKYVCMCMLRLRLYIVNAHLMIFWLNSEVTTPLMVFRCRFDFFYKKTGVSGPYVFGAGLLTTLLSKEIFVVEHEFPLIPPIIFLIWLAMTKGGPMLSAFLDKEIDKEEENLISIQEDKIVEVQDQIEEEEKGQWMAKGQSMLFEAKRENVALQLEAEYRKRQMDVYNDIKRRLDYQVEIQNTRRGVERRHMINWIISNVLKSMDEKQEKQNIDQCINNLSKLSTE